MIQTDKVFTLLIVQALRILTSFMVLAQGPPRPASALLVVQDLISAHTRAITPCPRNAV